MRDAMVVVLGVVVVVVGVIGVSRYSWSAVLVCSFSWPARTVRVLSAFQGFCFSEITNASGELISCCFSSSESTSDTISPMPSGAF